MFVRRPVRVFVLVLACALPAALPGSAAATEALAPPIAKTPGAHPRGTVMLLPASGWASPTRERQQSIWARMAPTLFAAGYRTVAIDYERGGAPGLASVQRAVKAESLRPRTGPLCLYGESSGGHLALIAANRMREIDCVVTFGAPVNFTELDAEVQRRPEKVGFASALQSVIDTFGADVDSWAGWDPADLRTPLRAPVLNMICEDDELVPPSQVGALPGAETFVAPSGDPGDTYVHGTISPAGLRAARRRIVGFVEQARRRGLSARRS